MLHGIKSVVQEILSLMLVYSVPKDSVEEGSIFSLTLYCLLVRLLMYF
jgi:hypothetical protein